MGLSSPGIGSNLDINGIISKLMQVESQPLVTLARKEASFQARLSALGSLSGALGSFQASVGSLANPATFQSMSATPSDSTILNASASGKATSGTYDINVSKLAQAQTIATAGMASATATIGGGTAVKLTFQFGAISGGKLSDGRYVSDAAATPPDPAFTLNADQATGTVTIDNTNNSLQGIRDAINKANIGVKATIVSDGSTTPNRLVLTSATTGVKSSMKITVDGAESALSDLLAYDPAGVQKPAQTAVAQDTAATINGIAVSSAKTSLTDAIEGVTLNLVKVGAATLNVARNSGGIQAGINGLVKAYNEFNTTYKKLTGYDPQTKQAGPLIGDSAAQNIQAQIRRTLGSALGDGSGGLKTLSDVGIAFQKDGVMTFDSAKLTKALEKGTDSVAALFSAIGTTTDSLVSFSSSTAATKAGVSDIFVTTLARQGNVTGSTPLGASTAIDSTNKELSITVDGITASVTLQENAGYSQSALAAQVQSAINGAAALSSAGVAVGVSVDAAGNLKIVSNRYGSASTISVSGNSIATLFGSAAAQPGIDAAGTIGGSPATGSGQFLTGANGTSAEGLKLQITGGAENTARGTVSFFQGFATQASKLIDSFIGSSGLLKGRSDGINRSITDLNRTREALGQRLANVEKRYRAQFTALDATISKMTATSSYLSQQLAALSKSIE